MPRERDGQCGVAGDVRTSQRVDGALASLRPYATRFARDMPGWSGSRQEGELAEFDRDPIMFGIRCKNMWSSGSSGLSGWEEWGALRN